MVVFSPNYTEHTDYKHFALHKAENICLFIFSMQTFLESDPQTNTLQNSSSSHQHAYSISQEIPRLLENLNGDGNYKTPLIKCEQIVHCIDTPTKLSVY